MKKTEFSRVSFTPVANFLVGNSSYHVMIAAREGTVNPLDAISSDGMKRMLKRVVEVQYTTLMLEVAG
jgi:roadblock/LC7 domain-containing protein